MDEPQKKEEKLDDGEDVLKKCQAERDEYLNGWKRAKADYINYQKDESKRLDEAVKFGHKAFMRELLLVLDSFDLAMVAMGKQIGAVEGGGMDKGIAMIRVQLEDIMKKYGLERIVVEVGKALDSNLHEPVVAVESTHPPGAVVEELERGYLLYSRVLRPARVAIAKEK